MRARYKQTFLGAGWALLTPLVLMGAFVLLFRRVTHVDTGPVPYALFALAAVIPWTFFSTAVSSATTSLLANASLLNRVACPREVFPLSSIAVAAVDACISSTLLVLLFAVYHRLPGKTVWLVPLLTVLLVAATVAVALMLAAFVVYARDVRHLVPLMLQFGLFITPVGYPLSRIPGEWRWAYSAVYPLGTVIDGFRQALLGSGDIRVGLLLTATASTAVMLGVAYVVFKRLEPGFADVA